VIQGGGGELPIPTFLASYSYKFNGSKSISYSSNVLFKKVDMNNSPRLMSGKWLVKSITVKISLFPDTDQGVKGPAIYTAILPMTWRFIKGAL